MIGIGSIAMVGASSGQIYKWVDENGVTHYTERPPAAGKARTTTTLDIELHGNDVPPYSSACSTIRCQYERLRRDRLLREAELRKEEESRARALAATKPTPLYTSPTGTGTGWIDIGVIPIRPYPPSGPPRPTPLPEPPPSGPDGGSRTPMAGPAPAPIESGGGSRTPAGRDER